MEANKEWLAALVGEYANPVLGKLSVEMRGTAAVLDVGEWKTPAAQKVDLDGSVNLLTTALGLRIEFVPGGERGRRTLTLKTLQQDYVFEGADGGR